MRGIERAEAATLELLSHEPVSTALFGGLNLLTTGAMAQDPAAIGRAAAQLFCGRIDGERFPSVHEMIPTRLITRGSGGIRP